MSEAPDILLEAAVDNVDAAVAAAEAGADRIELASSLLKGGVSPSPGMVKALKTVLKVPLFVLIRPRAGDFHYSSLEMKVMEEDILAFYEAGADGFVFGVLTEDRDIHEQANARLMELAKGRPCTFHRAFDVCLDPEKALDSIISLGFDRLLTSGQKPFALDGKALIRQCVDQAAGKIKVMAGGGVNSQNTEEILRETGVEELHFSAIRTLPGAMGTKGSELFPGKTAPFPGKVTRIRNAVKSFQGFRFLGQ